MIPQSACWAARAALLQPLMLLIVGSISWPSGWDTVHAVIQSVRAPGPGGAESDAHVLDYYQKLIGGPKGAESARWPFDLSPRLSGKPYDWINFKEADVLRYLDDEFIQFELKPCIRRTLVGQPFSTNAFGMHDEPVTLEKPEGTFRIALLGASMDMGWGVKYQDTYANRLQDWLTARASEKGSAGPRRFEVLNFAVAAYSPLQRLETLRRRVLAFRPDMVIYSATTLDDRLTEIHLCDMLPKGVDLQYDFVKEMMTEAKLVALRFADRRGGAGDPQGSAQGEAEAIQLAALRRDSRQDRGRMPLRGRADRDGDHPSSRARGLAGRASRARGAVEGPGLSSWADRLRPVGYLRRDRSGGPENRRQG